MPKFGQLSMERLGTCHPDLIAVCNEAIKIVDFSVICGHRGKVEQNKAHAEGKSEKAWPGSTHNVEPSKAVDLAPYPIDWKDLPRFYVLGGVMLACAARLGVRIRWGADWDGDGDILEHKFQDVGHFELR